jgi:hypothetical protein
VQLSPQTTIIAPEKLYDYVLNFANRDGESTARFLEERGYNQKNWQILEADLRAQHLSQEVRPSKKSRYGEKHEIVTPLAGPNGKKRWLRSIWMIRNGERVARFITLIPEKQP